METRLDRIEKAIEDLLLGISELKESQMRTDAQIMELKESQKKTDAQIMELKESQKKTDAQIMELKESQKKTDAQMRRTDAKLDRRPTRRCEGRTQSSIGSAGSLPT